VAPVAFSVDVPPTQMVAELALAVTVGDDVTEIVITA
jgi:hypothetical protein